MSDIIPEKTLDSAFSLGALSNTKIELPNKNTGVLVPQGFHLEQITPFDAPLTRIRRHQILHDIESFIEYTKTFMTDGTTIVAEPGFVNNDGRAVITAIFDFPVPGAADYCVHRAIYQPRYSDEWQTWISPGHQTFDQQEFGEFIEENKGDVREPTAGELLDIVRNFKMTRKVQFSKVIHDQDGTVKLAYSDEADAAGPNVVVPEQVTLGIPVFFTGMAYEVKLFVRYRMHGGKLGFTLKPDRPDYIENHAFMEAAKKVQEATEKTVLLGRA